MKSFENGAWTSEIAAGMAEQTGLKLSCEREILRYLERVERQGATDQELETALSRPGNTIRPARVELVRLELVVNPDGRWRPTVSHRPAKVWVLARFAADSE